MRPSNLSTTPLALGVLDLVSRSLCPTLSTAGELIVAAGFTLLAGNQAVGELLAVVGQERVDPDFPISTLGRTGKV